MKILLTGLLLLCASSLFADNIIGQDQEGNCYPFACFALDGGTVYEQLYSSAAFSGAIDIGSVDFFAETGSEGMGMDGATYTVSFSTVSAPLSSAYPISPGADSQEFGVFNIAGPMPAELTLTGTPFNYDPANGNLLMYVTVDSVAQTCYYCAYYEADGDGTLMSRAYTNMAGSLADSVGLVTEFDPVGGSGGSQSTIPEPASVFSMAAGTLLLALVSRRRKA